MSELSQPVSHRTIEQIERISERLFTCAEAIPGVGPEAIEGVGSGIRLREEGTFVRLIKRENDPGTFDARTELLTGQYGNVQIQDFRHNPESNKTRGVRLGRHNIHGGFVDVEPTAGKITENPSVHPRSGLLENYTSTRHLTEQQIRSFAAEIFKVAANNLRQANEISAVT